MLFTFVGWDRRACASLFDTLRVIGPSEVKAKMEALRVLGVRMGHCHVKCSNLDLVISV